MTEIKSPKNRAFNKSCDNVRTPSLKTVGYYKALDFVAFTITRDTLIKLGYSKQDASGLAGSTPGSARERFEAIL